MVGAYNGDASLKEGARHGVDFSLRGPPFLIGEIGLGNNYGKDAGGLAGNLKIGGYYDGGRYGLYLVGDEELWRWGASKDNRHLGAFGALAFTPDRQASVLPFFFDAGLAVYGPAPSRPKDFAGFAVVYGSYGGASAPAMGTPTSASGSRVVPDFEMTLEWMYGFKLVPGLLLEPDVQYIIHPGGERSIPNAMAVGLNAVVAL
jgi:porin